MSAGIYVLPAGSIDAQSPHRQDELYYVVKGRARMRAGAEDRSLEPGRIVFVAAHVEHRFYDIEEELTSLSFSPQPRPLDHCEGGIVTMVRVRAPSVTPGSLMTT